MSNDIPTEWVDELVRVHQDLDSRADWQTNTPAELLVSDEDAKDHEKWEWITARLVAAGWRIGSADPEAALQFFAPGPLTPPDEMTSALN